MRKPSRMNEPRKCKFSTRKRIIGYNLKAETNLWEIVWTTNQKVPSATAKMRCRPLTAKPNRRSPFSIRSEAQRRQQKYNLHRYFIAPDLRNPIEMRRRRNSRWRIQLTIFPSRWQTRVLRHSNKCLKKSLRRKLVPKVSKNCQLLQMKILT